MQRGTLREFDTASRREEACLSMLNAMRAASGVPDFAGSDDTSGCQSLQLWCQPLTTPRSQVRGSSRTSPHGDRRTPEHLVGGRHTGAGSAAAGGGARGLPAHHGAVTCARGARRRLRRRGRCLPRLPPRPELEAAQVEVEERREEEERQLREGRTRSSGWSWTFCMRAAGADTAGDGSLPGTDSILRAPVL